MNSKPDCSFTFKHRFRSKLLVSQKLPAEVEWCGYTLIIILKSKHSRKKFFVGYVGAHKILKKIEHLGGPGSFIFIS